MVCHYYVYIATLFIIICMQGVFDIDKERGLILVEISKGVSVHDIQGATGCSFEASLTIFH